MYYPCCMPSIITKWKKGNPYLYWVRSARVEGRPRIVEQVYLGPRDHALERIHEVFTTGSPALPVELKRIQVKEFGASGLFWSLAGELELVGILDTVIPPPPAGRRTGLSVGLYLVLAAINRAICPHSKRSFGEWYDTTVLSRLVEASPKILSSQRFWDHMHLVSTSHIQQVQKGLVARLTQLFALNQHILIYDTTNYYTFVSTFNARTSLVQRGKNKQKRTDLRQLSVAVVLEEASGLPIYHRCYEGDITDVKALRPMIRDLLEVIGKDDVPSGSRQRRTLIFDKGNASQANLKALREDGFSFVAAIPSTWESPLWKLPLSAYCPVTVEERQRVKVAEQIHPEWDQALECQGKAVMVFSPPFYRQQVHTLDLLQQRADVKLQELTGTLDGHNRHEASVRKQVAQLVRADHLSQFFSYTLSLDGNRVVALHWLWDSRKKAAIKHRRFGRTLIYTDRQDLDAQRIVELYHQQAQIEALFRITKSRRPGLWWPSNCWTDAQLRVHALTCFLATLMLQIVLKRLKRKQLTICPERLIEQLRGTNEALAIYNNGASQRILADRTPLQEELCYALNIHELARQMGNTVPID